MDPKNKPNVVVIGGGTGIPIMLRGLKKYPVNLTAIVTVADDGGSSGVLRHEFMMPPPGDIRNVLAALSEAEPLFEDLLQYRFENGHGLTGHSLGNLLLTALTSLKGDFATGVRELSRVLNISGQVLPVSNSDVVLNAKMKDGTIVHGESKIPTQQKQIENVFLTPEDITAYSESVAAIRAADLIVLGPGSLYTSILPNLLVPGIAEALAASEAERVYVCNVMSQFGETQNFTAADHVQVLMDHMDGSFIDTILVNDDDIPERLAERYEQENAEPVMFDKTRLQSFGFRVINDKLIKDGEPVLRHDETKVAEILYSLISPRYVSTR